MISHLSIYRLKMIRFQIQQEPYEGFLGGYSEVLRKRTGDLILFSWCKHMESSDSRVISAMCRCGLD